MKKELGKRNKAQATQPPRNMPTKAECEFTVQDNSPRQPGNWSARVCTAPPSHAKQRRTGRRPATPNVPISQADDRYLRLRAEMENMKKRVAREKDDLYRHALENIMRDLLPVLDSFAKGFTALGHDTNLAQTPFAAGMKLVDEQLRKVLADHGLQAISSCGELFDPRLHQAIRREESSTVTNETVAEEYAKGYQLHDRLLRPAMVSVRVPTSSVKTTKQ